MIGDLRRLGRRLVRHASVSAIATASSLTVLGLLVTTGATSPGWANVIATGVGHRFLRAEPSLGLGKNGAARPIPWRPVHRPRLGR